MILLLFFVLTPCLVFSLEKQVEPWFKSQNFQSLKIVQDVSISVHKVKAEVEITDAKVIQNIVDRIKKIPADGDMMVKFGPDAQLIKLIFQDGKNQEVIPIYNQGFKTPSTGFNSDPGTVEKELYRDIVNLLKPELGHAILNAKGMTARFKDFAIRYVGSEESPKAPVTASFSRNSYVVKAQDGHEQTITVTSGQTSPQPQKFMVGKTSYTLLTYELPDGFRLFPDYFAVVK